MNAPANNLRSSQRGRGAATNVIYAHEEFDAARKRAATARRQREYRERRFEQDDTAALALGIGIAFIVFTIAVKAVKNWLGAP